MENHKHKRNRSVWGYEFVLTTTARKEIVVKDKENQSETVHLQTYLEKFQFNRASSGNTARGKPLKWMNDAAKMVLAIAALIISFTKLATAVMNVLE